MKIKTTAALAASLFIAGFAGSVSAHDIRFKTLKLANASATDVWEITCSGGSQRLVAQLNDFRADDANFLSLVIYKDGKAVTTTDPVGGDSADSPLVSVNGGDGVYSMIVSHTLAELQVYNIEYHCERADGFHTPTTVPSTPVQDQ